MFQALDQGVGPFEHSNTDCKCVIVMPAACMVIAVERGLLEQAEFGLLQERPLTNRNSRALALGRTV